MVTLPSLYSPVTVEELTGQVPLRNDPIRAIVDNTNFLYGQHAPALVNFAGLGNAGVQNTYYYPVIPSADGLDYTIRTHTWGNTPLAQTTLTVDTSNTNTTGAWTPLLTDAWTRGTAEEWRTHSTTMTLAAGVRYLRIRLASASTCQLHACIVYPTAQTTTTAAAKPCGFIPFDLAFLNTPGGSIHTELFNRARDNCRAVLRDRRQAVWSFVNNVDRLDTFGDVGQILRRLMALSQSSMVGQSGATVTVRARIAGAGTTSVEEVGSSGAVSFTNNNTDQTDTIQIKTDRPAFRAVTEPGGANQTPYYIVIDWRPGD